MYMYVKVYEYIRMYMYVKVYEYIRMYMYVKVYEYIRIYSYVLHTNAQIHTNAHMRHTGGTCALEVVQACTSGAVTLASFPSNTPRLFEYTNGPSIAARNAAQFFEKNNWIPHPLP